MNYVAKMKIETQIKLLQNAINALEDVETVSGRPAIAETLAKLNKRLRDRWDEINYPNGTAA